MLLIKTFFPWAWKSPKNAHCLPGKEYIPGPHVIYFHFFYWKKQFWTDFHIFPSEPSYIYTMISIKKLFIKWFNNIEK